MDRWWEPLLREAVAGRDVIFAGAFPAAWGDHVKRVTEAGARRCMIVATDGAGMVPGPAVPTHVVEPPPGLGLLPRVRFGVETLRHPPADLIQAVDEFDPDRAAVVIGTFLNEASELDGRPLLAHRRPEWVALEDKTVADALWDRAGVPRLRSEIVPLADAVRAAEAVDDGDGTVWAADARDGFNGGAHGTFWVADARSRARALGELTPICDRVRVMPFVAGTPCSIHGIVLPDGVVALRPVEIVTLRRGREFVYTGCATFWDPDDSVRAAMRDAVRQVGMLLAEEVEFRGAFTVDGVAADRKFWPTELNPRWGAGLNVIDRSMTDIPLLLVNDLLTSGAHPPIAAAELEAEVLAHADAVRAGGTWTTTSPDTVEVEPRPAVYTGGAWRWAEGDETPAGEVVAAAAFTRVAFDPSATPVGTSVAARAAAFWAFTDRELSTGLGELTTFAP